MLTRAAIRSFSASAYNVVNDVAKQRFVVSLNAEKAVIQYELNGKTITFHNTEVPSIFQGHGVGKLLAKHAFDYAKQNNLDVVCHCSFLNKYYKDNKGSYLRMNVKCDSLH